MASVLLVILVLASLVEIQGALTVTEQTKVFRGFGRVPEARIVGKPKLYLPGQYRVKTQSRPETSGGIVGEPAEFERLKRQVVQPPYKNTPVENDSLNTIPGSSDDSLNPPGKPVNPVSPPENLSPISSASAGRNYGSSSLYTSAIAGQNMQIIPENAVIPGMYTAASAGHVLSPFFYFHVPMASFFSSATAGLNPMLTPQATGNGIHKGTEQDSVALFASANAGSRPIDSGVPPVQNSTTTETNKPDESNKRDEKIFPETHNDSATSAADTRKPDQPKDVVEVRTLSSNPNESIPDTVSTKNASAQPGTQTPDVGYEEKPPIRHPDSSESKTGDSSVQSTPQKSESIDDEESSIASQTETVSKEKVDSNSTSLPPVMEERLSKRNILKKDDKRNARAINIKLEDGIRALQRKVDELFSYITYKTKSLLGAPVRPSNMTEDYYIDDFETIYETASF